MTKSSSNDVRNEVGYNNEDNNYSTTTTAASSSSSSSVVEEEESVTALHDFIAGGIAGSASILVGHPFDTIKVRLQTASGSTSLMSVASSFGGISSLFRGLGPPLVSAAAVNAIIFSSYGASSRVWDTYLGSNNTPQNELGHDPWQKAMMCGSFAGAVQCLVICPMEHLKCRLQVQHGTGALDNIYKGPLDATQQIVRRHGFFDGLFRGWNVTCLREIPSFGVYFATYDYVKDRIQESLLQRHRQQIQQSIVMNTTAAASSAKTGTTITTDVQQQLQLQQQQQDYEDHYAHARLLASSAVAGGLSGCLTWLCVYPVDVIKTTIQTNPLHCHQPYHRSILPVAQSIVAKHGWRSLFRGLGVTLVRAFPVNGTVFPVYEFTLMHVTNLKYDDNYDYSYDYHYHYDNHH